jgi:hypothetical protein
MHHCVASYADREQSIIVSIREGSTEGRERVTCEFNLQKHLVQAKYFCNAQPPAHMEYAILNHLSPKVRRNAKLGLLHASEKLKVPIIINGVEVKKEESISHYDYDLYF